MANEQFTEVLRNRDGKALLVKFGATWCGPCKALQPILEELAVEWEEYIDFFAVDVDDDPELAIKYKIRSVPVIFMFDDESQFMARLNGMRSKTELSNFLNGFYS